MNSKQAKISTFDPSSVAQSNTGIFGLPFDEAESETVVLPVPWEVTVSYRAGTADGPTAIFEASRQVDLRDRDLPDAWKRGIYMREIPDKWHQLSRQLRAKAVSYLEEISEVSPHNSNKKLLESLQEINEGCRALHQWIREESLKLLDSGKRIAVLGGDHSSPLGLIEALSQRYQDFGILQIDAHCDLRDAYEGFQFSHASIMYNALSINNISKLVQVGIRDYCDEEEQFIANSNGRVMAFFDHDLARAQYEGKNWRDICHNIIKELPKHVYLSFDIDGLIPELCPHTGTPVPGGLTFNQAVYLIQLLARSGRRIIAFDLCEVAPGDNEWDANVGARLLYKICNLAALSGEC